MMSVPFHACTSCKANISPSDKHLLFLRCLGVQHTTEAMGREDFCDLCVAFQPRVRRNRLRRAMGLDTQSPTAEPSAALGAPSPLLQLSQSPSQEKPVLRLQVRRVKCSKQARDLELLSRQQAPVALVKAQAPLTPVPDSAPGSPIEAQVELDPQPRGGGHEIFSDLLG
ncbi:UNVERIFIED_CONTAM: hypothetical protein FKN15_051105 [Acipenser sinensis]